jgi:hypothetical protein
MRYLLILLLTGCQAYVGGAFHQEGELNDLDHNPLGIVRIHADTREDTQVFCEHVSSIPDNDEGLTMCGALWRIY